MLACTNASADRLYSAAQAQPERPSHARGGWREAVEQEQEQDAPAGPLPGVRSHDFATVQSRAAAVRQTPPGNLWLDYTGRSEHRRFWGGVQAVARQRAELQEAIPPEGGAAAGRMESRLLSNLDQRVVAEVKRQGTSNPSANLPGSA